MDKILLGIFKSDTKPEIKRALLSKIIQAARTPQTSEVIEHVLRVALDYSIKIDHQPLWSDALAVYKEWACHNLSTFLTFWNLPANVTYVFTNGYRDRCVLVIIESLRLLSSKNGTIINNAQSPSSTIATHCTAFFKANQDLSTALSLCDLFAEFANCLPNGSDCVLLCNLMLCVISRQHFQAKTTGANIVAQMKDFEKDIEKMATLLEMIWSRQETTATDLQQNMLTLFGIISSVSIEDDVPVFPIALGSVVKHLKSDFAGNFAESIATNDDITNGQYMSALLCLVSWLNWPTITNLDLWLKALLDSLAAHGKVDLCVHFAEDNIETVFRKLELPHAAEACYNIIEYLLSKYTHSALLFHKILTLVEEMLSTMKKMSPAHPVYTSLSQNIARLCFNQIELHPGYPEIYDSVLDLLKGYERPPSPALKRKARSHSWVISHDILYSPRKANSSFSLPKDEYPGLQNLGNTCYMNSCIQALYFVDRFRRRILDYDITALEPAFWELQKVFLFLKYTERPYYCPESFSQKCRPSYFTLGTQQDAAEYLRYFLDHLHEQYCRTVKDGLGALYTQQPVQEQNTVPQNVVNKISRLKQKVDGVADGHDGDHGDASTSQLTHGNTQKKPCLDGDIKSHSAVERMIGDFEKLSLTQEIFGGSLESCIKCMVCATVSCQSEKFIDITLAFSDGSSKQKSSSSMKGKQSYRLSDMLESYFVTEKLEGDNKYFCDTCEELCNAEKRMNIKIYPETLVLTLMRFKYDTKTHAMSKISGEVRFPLVLSLPEQNGAKSPSTTCVYTLTAVFIHSGISLHGGHYYVYTRHVVPLAGVCDGDKPLNEYEDLLEDKWYLANDETVTEKVATDFLNITQKYHRDTPYMLFYTKVDAESLAKSESKDPTCPKELLAVVQKDNEKYRKEMKDQKRKARLKMMQRSRDRDDPAGDGNEPPGPCGGHFNNSFDSPRFIF